MFTFSTPSPTFYSSGARLGDRRRPRRREDRSPRCGSPDLGGISPSPRQHQARSWRWRPLASPPVYHHDPWIVTVRFKFLSALVQVLPGAEGWKPWSEVPV